jgi:hypothetical protein
MFFGEVDLPELATKKRGSECRSSFENWVKKQTHFLRISKRFIFIEKFQFWVVHDNEVFRRFFAGSTSLKIEWRNKRTFCEYQNDLFVKKSFNSGWFTTTRFSTDFSSARQVFAHRIYSVWRESDIFLLLVVNYPFSNDHTDRPNQSIFARLR